MKQEIMDYIVKNIPNITDDYIQSIINRYNEYIQYTQLPKVNLVNSLDTKKLPAKCKKLLDNSYTTINTSKSIFIQLNSYKPAGFITSAIIQNYFCKSVVNDTHLATVLYIDTNLLIEDYKKLMDKDSESTSPQLVHSLDVLYKEIECADYVFWDKFTLATTNYAISKLYQIISIRYRNCLGNAFFITQDKQSLSQIFSQELLDVMNISTLYEMQLEQYSYIKGSE